MLQFIRRGLLGTYRLVNIMHVLGKLAENTKTQIAEYIEKHTLLRESAWLQQRSHLTNLVKFFELG